MGRRAAAVANPDKTMLAANVATANTSKMRASRPGPHRPNERHCATRRSVRLPRDGRTRTGTLRAIAG